jgi:hypothetical protein
MITQGSYLRVLSPRTTNGNNVVVDPQTRMVAYKEDHLPLSAKRYLELYNKNLPQHLRKIIEVVKGSTAPSATVHANTGEAVQQATQATQPATQLAGEQQEQKVAKPATPSAPAVKQKI